jgi:sensor histidine kinase YesM
VIERQNIQGSTSWAKDHVTSRHIFLDYLYTIIISVLIALFLTAVGISKPFLSNLIMSLSFGISICTLIHLLILIFNPEPGKVLSLVYIMVAGVVGGIVIGWQLGSLILRRFFSIMIGVGGSAYHMQTLILGLVFGGTAAYFFYSRARLRVISETAEKERIDRLSSEKETLEAKLRLLQAQIEPHFLFNTLSNVLSLIDTEPARGKTMLMDLVCYLRISLSRTLPEKTTLSQEIGMIEAYLNIQKIRMGERLSFRIELPETLRQRPFPPMLLQPLVENAIRHGLEPKIDGGEVAITASESDSVLRIKVVDTGIGIGAYQKNGVWHRKCKRTSAAALWRKSLPAVGRKRTRRSESDH